MLRTHRKLLGLLSVLLMAAFSAQAAFVTYSGPGAVDTTIFTTLVDLNTPVTGVGFGTTISNATPIQVFDDGSNTISFSVPNAASVGPQINFGATHDFSNLGQSLSQYIFTQTTNSDVVNNIAANMLFTAGPAVSAIGIHISYISSPLFNASDRSSVSLEILFSDNTTASTSITPSTQATNNPTQAAFYGYTSASNNIVGFRITGGQIMIDNLRFGSLGGDPGNGGGDPGNGGGDPPDPAAIPEASTFLLCGSVLGLLGLLRRRRA